MSAEGALLFARYAYPPNELGYCGPADAAGLLRRDATADIERRARQFEGAWCYLEYLAETAGLPDPLDARVVEAYWIGNDLLDRVDPAALVERMTDRFRGQLGGTWREAGRRALAHHSFQVFEVYPWAPMLRSSGNPTALSVLDQCRIRTGVVLGADSQVATVRSRPLSWDGAELVTGAWREETVRCSAGGRTLIGSLAPGDRVALHWDWVCDVLTDEQAWHIESLEERRRTALRPLVP
ncbi:DUF6390 family protein [Streptomyces sp. NBC_01766]|uniref:DUF6390 family protein n=1 Tax=Streptomyces sp. NBC_01766 TaxID=2975936 RepID=UPI002DDA65B8|nr:DUF6390 family protein [Streptomyces sp. NBC_01766]WSC24363.1 DUF6390 family protein [Streptomyces sp. NBC_01766]